MRSLIDLGKVEFLRTKDTFNLLPEKICSTYIGVLAVESSLILLRFCQSKCGKIRTRKTLNTDTFHVKLRKS